MSSCLSVDIRKASISLDANISKIGDVFSFDVTKLDGIEVSTSLYGRYICSIISDYGSHLQVSCGIVCSLSDVFYLVVSPDEPQWITSDDNIIYDVTSNVIWTVE